MFGHGSLDLLNRTHSGIGRVDVTENDADGPGQRMGVDVDQTGQHSASLQIDSARVWSSASGYSRVDPYGFDSTVAYRQRGHNTAIAVHRNHVTVSENKVGGRAFGCPQRTAKRERQPA